jgi:hypothetical protein
MSEESDLWYNVIKFGVVIKSRRLTASYMYMYM